MRGVPGGSVSLTLMEISIKNKFQVEADRFHLELFLMEISIIGSTWNLLLMEISRDGKKEYPLFIVPSGLFG